MRTLAAKLLLLLLPLALISGWLELELRAMPNSYNQKRDLLEPRLPGLRVLVLGASQENQDIAAGLLDEDAFDLACVGQDWYYDRLLALKYLDRMPKLRLVVLTLSYVSVAYQLRHSPEAWRGFQYRLYYGLPDEDPGSRYDLRNFSALAFTGPLDALKDACNRFRGNPDVVFGPDGQQRVPALSDTVLGFIINGISAGKRISYLESTMREQAVPENLALLKDLLQTLALRHVQVVFISSPVTDEYRQAMDMKLWAGHRSEALALAKKFNARYYDYLADPRFTDEDFSDVDHLNVSGADKFTRILKKDFVDPLLKEKPAAPGPLTRSPS